MGATPLGGTARYFDKDAVFGEEHVAAFDWDWRADRDELWYTVDLERVC